MEACSPTSVEKFVSDTLIENLKKYHVIEIVNSILANETRTFHQKSMISKILDKNPTLKRADVFSKHLLDFEPVFRTKGWKVVYDKPSYCEHYEAFWTFSPKKRCPHCNEFLD